MRRFLTCFVLMAGLFPASTRAQAPETRISATLADEHDAASDGYTYVAFADLNTNSGVQPLRGALGAGTVRNIRVKTIASSTTITAVTALTGPFDGLAAGDLLLFNAVTPLTDLNTSGQREVVIASVTSDDEVVVSAAINLSVPTTGYTFRFKKKLTDTGADEMFFDVSQFSWFNIQADVEAINATSLDFVLECRANRFGLANQLYTKNFTAVGSTAISVSVPQEQCRVGWAFNTDTGVQDVAVYFVGVR